MAPRLKVFRTPAGFVDAVVAAPSRKAALLAWGVHENVFATGAAHEVTDPDLAARALAAPGEVLRVPRSTPEGFVQAAQPPEGGRPAKAKAAPATPGRAQPPSPPPPPPPDRRPLDRAETALAKAERSRDAELARMDAELAELQGRRNAAQAQLDAAVARAAAARDAALRAYDAAERARRGDA